MVIYNFLDSKLSPKVSSTAAALDEYEVSNLLSHDALVRSRGYMAYTSTKPPVDIVFEFICNIHIHYIKLQTKLGSHKTVGIEVLASSPLTSIGYQLFETDGLIICDSKFYSKQNLLIPEGYHLSYFKRYQHSIFMNTNKLCIRIVRTDCRSVPCLGTVEIWGSVSKSCPDITKQTIHKLMNKGFATQVCEPTEHTSTDLIENGFKIPDDFKDALTFDVMSLPMTLPSGNTIDKYTLERCISNDMVYGRKPSDPFTGLEFLPTRKPILNTALKSRIDLFLLNNSEQSATKNIGRTLGFKNMTQPVCSKKIKLDPGTEPSTGDKLDDAIAKVLSSKNFTCFTNFEKVGNDCNIACNSCKLTTNLYKITLCTHYFCKLCLLKLNAICSKCRTKFKNSDVIKFNS